MASPPKGPRGPRVARVETIPLALPVKVALVESGGTFSKFDHVLIKLHTNDGMVGLGEVEAYPSFERLGVEPQAGIVAVIRDHLAPCVVGASPFEVTAIWQRMDKAVEGYNRVKAGIDIALHDLMGKTLGVPVHALLGGKMRDSYVVEGVGYGISIDRPKIVASVARRAAAHGYRQLELKAGDPDPEMDIARLRAVRKAIGPKMPVKIDFNGFHDTKTAIRIIRAMEPLGVQWIEQPARYWDLDSLARIRAATTVNIVVDETVETPQDMMKVVAHGAADSVHIKPTVKGGLTMARKIAAVAEAAGLEIVPGTSAPTGVGMAAAQAFIASARTLSGGAHGSPLDVLVDDVVKNPIPPGSTSVRIGDKPGLGIELDERIVRKYRAD